MYTVKEYTIKNNKLDAVIEKRMREREIKSYYSFLIENGYKRVRGNGLVGLELEYKRKNGNHLKYKVEITKEDQEWKEPIMFV